MNWINKLERRFGRYAIHNLPAVMIGLYVAGYILSVTSPTILNFLTLEPYYILHGQIWRVITWVIVPPETFGIFTIIMLFFYFSIGRTLEQTWGAFRFNLYIFTGILFTVIGALILHAFYPRYLIGGLFSTYYINMSIFLAFALSYPDMHVLLYFIIPVKMKWMGMLYGALTVYEMIRSSWPVRVAIIASLLNFILYFLLSRNSGRAGMGGFRRQEQFRQSVKKVQPKGNTVTIHRCAICGRTEKDGDNLVFRYCSKCDGAYEYCQDHLFTHQHIRAQ